MICNDLSAKNRPDGIFVLPKPEKQPLKQVFVKLLLGEIRIV